jgi:hypothetical protein
MVHTSAIDGDDGQCESTAAPVSRSIGGRLVLDPVWILERGEKVIQEIKVK